MTTQIDHSLHPQASAAVTCLRCGGKYDRPPVHLYTVMQLKKIPADARLSKLVELEKISEVDAAAWLAHNMHHSCPKKEAHCSQCGGVLITWQAKWCRYCNYDWH